MSVKRPLSNGQAYFAPQANPERPTTPVNPISASMAAISLEATPKSRGSGSYTASGGFTDARVVQVYPWIARDISSHGTCAFDQFLQFALERVDNATTVDPTVRLEKTLTAMLSICNDTGFQGLLREYCEEVTDERERYAPFVAIFNEALRRLGTIKVSECKYRKRDALDIHFCRNAEKEIEGIHFSGVDVNQTVSTKRKPDIVLSALATLMRIYEVEEGYDNFLAAAMEQPPQNLSWHEVLGSWEFKLDKTKLDYPEEMHYGTTLQTEYGPMKLDQHSATHEIRKVGDRSPPAKRKKKEFIQPIAATQRIQELRRSVRLKNKHEGADQGQAPAFDSRGARDVPGKKEAMKERPDPAIQTALYGAEMLSCATTKSHAIGFVVFDSIVHMWWYDHEGAIQTTGINFLTDLPRFLALLFAFQRFDVEDWGLIRGFDSGAITALENGEKRQDPQPYEVAGCQCHRVKVHNSVTVYRTLGLKGRGTMVVGASCATLGEEHPAYQKPLVAKLSWMDHTRLAEAEIIARAVERAHGNLTIINHMPIVVDSKEYSEYNTRTIRVKLGIPLRTRHLDGREVEVYRVLRLIVTERLYPVHRLTGEKFVRAWFQCAEVHYLNWLNGIHHQDLSLNNLMRRARDDDTICAVLNDWDLAIDAYEPQTCTGFEVTGTIPFMAIDLLREAALVGKVKHLYRHDLEAFFWIFIWVICCYKDGKRLDPLPQLYHEWTLGDMRLCRMGKNVLLAEVGWEGVDPTSTWVVEARIAAGLIQYLDKTQVARRSHKSPNDIGTKGRSKDAAQAAEDEEDEPEKVWNEFVEEMRDAGQSDPALGYILSLLTREWA